MENLHQWSTNKFKYGLPNFTITHQLKDDDRKSAFDDC
jgi:hypothetical protein